jgi:hypothetical protein
MPWDKSFKPDIYNKNPINSRRKRAHAMFLEGKNVDEVCEALGLKRSTASVYLFEARHIAAEKRDELLL